MCILALEQAKFLVEGTEWELIEAKEANGV